MILKNSLLVSHINLYNEGQTSKLVITTKKALNKMTRKEAFHFLIKMANELHCNGTRLLNNANIMDNHCPR